jgi:hypothetical protein
MMIVFITSDRLKGKGVWQFGLDSVIGLMEQTAGDWPAVARVIRNPETGETEVWAGNSEPPKEWTKKADKLVREWASKLLPRADN